jgi:hypothetical protein
MMGETGETGKTGKIFNPDLDTDQKISEMQRIVREIGHRVNGDHPMWLLDSINETNNIPKNAPHFIIPTVNNASSNVWRPVRFIKETTYGYLYHNNTIGGHYIKDGVCTGGNNLEFNYKEITRDEYINYYYNIALQYEEEYGDKNES